MLTQVTDVTVPVSVINPLPVISTCSRPGAHAEQCPECEYGADCQQDWGPGCRVDESKRRGDQGWAWKLDQAAARGLIQKWW